MVVVILLAVLVAFFLLKAIFRTGDSLILKKALIDHELAKSKISSAIANQDEILANELYQQEIGRLMHNLQLARISNHETEHLLNSFQEWFKQLR